MEQRNIRNITHCKREFYEALGESLAAIRPVGANGSTEHRHRLGVIYNSGEELNIEASLERCGDDMRVIMWEGGYLRYTVRITQIGQCWYAANKRAQVEVAPKRGSELRSRWEDLRNKKFYDAESYVEYLYDCMYNRTISRKALKYAGVTA